MSGICLYASADNEVCRFCLGETPCSGPRLITKETIESLDMSEGLIIWFKNGPIRGGYDAN